MADPFDPLENPGVFTSAAMKRRAQAKVDYAIGGTQAPAMVDPLAGNWFGETGRAVVANTMNTVPALEGLGRKLVGDNEGAMEAFGRFQQGEEEARSLGPAIQSMDDARAAGGGIGDYAASIAFQGASMLPDLAMSVTGAGIGSAVAKNVAVGAARRVATKELTGFAANRGVFDQAKKEALDAATAAARGPIGQDAARVAARQGIESVEAQIKRQVVAATGRTPRAEKIGSFVGAAAGQFPGMNTANVDILSQDGTDQADAGKALLGTTLASALGAVPIERFLGKFGGQAVADAAAAKAKFLPRVAKEFAAQGLSEGSMEVAQEVAQRASHYWIDKNTDMVGPEAMDQYLASFAGGFIAGGALGGAGEVGRSGAGAARGLLGNAGENTGKLRASIRENIRKYADKAREARSKAGEVYESAKASAGGAYESAKSTASGFKAGDPMGPSSEAGESMVDKARRAADAVKGYASTASESVKGTVKGAAEKFSAAFDDLQKDEDLDARTDAALNWKDELGKAYDSGEAPVAPMGTRRPKTPMDSKFQEMLAGSIPDDSPMRANPDGLRASMAALERTMRGTGSAEDAALVKSIEKDYGTARIDMLVGQGDTITSAFDQSRTNIEDGPGESVFGDEDLRDGQRDDARAVVDEDEAPSTYGAEVDSKDWASGLGETGKDTLAPIDRITSTERSLGRIQNELAKRSRTAETAAATGVGAEHARETDALTQQRNVMQGQLETAKRELRDELLGTTNDSRSMHSKDNRVFVRSKGKAGTDGTKRANAEYEKRLASPRYMQLREKTSYALDSTVERRDTLLELGKMVRRQQAKIRADGTSNADITAEQAFLRGMEELQQAGIEYDPETLTEGLIFPQVYSHTDAAGRKQYKDGKTPIMSLTQDMIDAVRTGKGGKLKRMDSQRTTVKDGRTVDDEVGVASGDELDLSNNKRHVLEPKALPPGRLIDGVHVPDGGGIRDADANDPYSRIVEETRRATTAMTLPKDRASAIFEAGKHIGYAELEKRKAGMTERRYNAELERLEDPETGEAKRQFKKAMNHGFVTASARELNVDQAEASGSDGEYAIREDLGGLRTADVYDRKRERALSKKNDKRWKQFSKSEVAVPKWKVSAKTPRAKRKEAEAKLAERKATILAELNKNKRDLKQAERKRSLRVRQINNGGKIIQDDVTGMPATAKKPEADTRTANRQEYPKDNNPKYERNPGTLSTARDSSTKADSADAVAARALTEKAAPADRVEHRKVGASTKESQAEGRNQVAENRAMQRELQTAREMLGFVRDDGSLRPLTATERTQLLATAMTLRVKNKPMDAAEGKRYDDRVQALLERTEGRRAVAANKGEGKVVATAKGKGVLDVPAKGKQPYVGGSIEGRAADARLDKKLDAIFDDDTQFDNDGAVDAVATSEPHDHGKETSLVNAILAALGFDYRVHVTNGDDAFDGGFSASGHKVMLGDGLNGKERIEVLAHETGHAVVAAHIGKVLGIDPAKLRNDDGSFLRGDQWMDLLAKADPKLHAELTADYEAWLGTVNRRAKNTTIRASRAGKSRAEGIIKRNHGTPFNKLTPEEQVNLLSMNEWLADNIARALASKAEGQTLIGKFFKDLADALTKAYDMMFRKGANKKWAPAPSVDAWVQSLFDADKTAVQAVTGMTVTQVQAEAAVEAAVANKAMDVFDYEADYHRLIGLINITMNKETRQILDRVLNTRAAVKQLREHYADNQAALNAIDDAKTGLENRIAYAYAAWQGGHLKVGPQGAGYMHGLGEDLESIFGLAGDGVYAQRIFTDMASGRIDKLVRNGKTYDAVAAEQRRSGSKAQSVYNTLQEFKAKVGEPLSKAFESKLKRMWDSGVPGMRELAALIHRPQGTTGDDQGYTPAVRDTAHTMTRQAMAMLKDLDPKHRVEAIDMMQRQFTKDTVVTKADGTTHMPWASKSIEARTAVVALRKFFDEAYDYAKKAGVDVGKRELFFPVTFDTENGLTRSRLTELYSDPDFEAAIRALPIFNRKETVKEARARVQADRDGTAAAPTDLPPVDPAAMTYFAKVRDALAAKKRDKLAAVNESIIAAITTGTVADIELQLKLSAARLERALARTAERNAKENSEAALDSELQKTMALEQRYMRARIEQLKAAGAGGGTSKPAKGKIDWDAPNAPDATPRDLPNEMSLEDMIKNMVDGALNSEPTDATTGSDKPNFRGANLRISQFVYDLAVRNEAGLVITPDPRSPEKKAADIKKFAATQSKNAAEIMARYIEPMVKQTEYTRRFGANGEVKDRIFADMKAQGATDEQLGEADDILKAALGTYGAAGSPTLAALSPALAAKFSGKKSRTAVEVGQAYQNARVLPLSLLSSLVDPMGVAIRTGGDFSTAWDGFKVGMQSLWNKDTRGEMNDALNFLGAADEIVPAMASTQGFDGKQNSLAQKTNELVFKANLMSGWVRATRFMALHTAHNFMLKHAGGDSDTSTRYMAELGIQPGDVMESWDLSPDGKGKKRVKLLDDGERSRLLQQINASEGPAAAGTALSTKVRDSDQRSPDEAQAELDRDDRVRAALMQFVNEAVLRTHSQQTPLWHSDPYMGLVTQYKSFGYAIYDQIGGRISREMQHGNNKIVLATLAYLPIVIMGEMIRGLIQYGIGGNPKRDEWGPVEYTMLGMERSGLFIDPSKRVLLDSIQDASSGRMPGSSQIGPSAGQAKNFVTTRDYGKAFEEALPGSAAYKRWNDEAPAEGGGAKRRSAEPA